MAQRKVSVMTKARDKIAYIAYSIKPKGMPNSAKEFVEDCNLFFENLGDSKLKIGRVLIKPGLRKVIIYNLS